MKDFAKLAAAGAILSLLILYGGFGGPGENVGQAQEPLTVATASETDVDVTPAVARMAAGATAASPTMPLVVADAAKAPVLGPAEWDADVAKPKVKTMRFVVYFDFNSTKVSDRARETLRLATEFAKSVNAKHIDLSGFADRAGPAGYNMKLSERRAKVVAAALKGLDAGLRGLDVKGFGESRPAVDTPDGLAEQRNRRVEIVISA